MREDNKTFDQNNQTFRNACEKASIPATKRQASKFRLGRGLAFKAMKNK